MLDRETILDSIHHEQHTIYDRIDNEDKKIERIQRRRCQIVSFTADIQISLLTFACLTLSWGRSLSCRNQSIDFQICISNQWTGFYMIGTSVMKKLKSTMKTPKICEISSKLTLKTLERRQWFPSSPFIVDFKHISCIILVFHCWLLTSEYRLGCVRSSS